MNKINGGKDIVRAHTHTTRLAFNELRKVICLFALFLSNLSYRKFFKRQAVSSGLRKLRGSFLIEKFQELKIYYLINRLLLTC